ncbi:MAG TPA: ATPase domain-containing protein [Chloroflexota bacterium]|nr:ATPase domain-containing protein [Chloroflexota bacterium]
MSDSDRVRIPRLHTGVPGLDRVLDLEAGPGEGGLPEYSFNLLAGGPGAGKTTLAQQIVFANATPDRTALYFTVLGEPPLKMLRYQQAYSFFDPAKLDGSIHFVNLSQEVLNGDLSRVLDTILREVEERSPSLVVVDSFRTVVRAVDSREQGELEIQAFVQRLAQHLTSWQATTFLVGEYGREEPQDNPVFTVADGIIWLMQSVDQNSVVRKLQVMKMRGQAPMPGLQTFRITDDGIRVYPRIPRPVPRVERAVHPHRVSTGVTGLDEMMHGGIPAGDAVILGGPSGSGKTTLSTQFIAEGVRRGEPGVIAVFEEHPHDYERRAKEFGIDLEAMVKQGLLEIIYLHPLDLSVDEALYELQEAVDRVKAQRVVIDSLSGFQLTLAPTFRQDYRESLYRLVSALTGVGITILMTVEIIQSFTNLLFTSHEVSFLSDDIIYERYVELEGELRKVISVIKMRSSAHSRDLREYTITDHGIEIGRTLTEYRGIITGIPQLREAARRPIYPGLSDGEIAVLQTLVSLKEATAPVLAEATGLRRPALNAALDRLVALNYAIRGIEERQTVYRPVAQVLRG